MSERNGSPQNSRTPTRKGGSQKESDEFKQKNEEFDRQRAALLKKRRTKQEPNVSASSTKRGCRRRVAFKTAEALRNEEHNLHQAISRRTEQEVFAIARKALSDLATVSLEERLGEVFTRRLREMDSRRKQASAKPLRKRLTQRSYAARSTCLRSNERRYKMRSTKPSRLKSISDSRPHQT